MDRLKNGIYFDKNRFLKPLPSCKYVNPLHYYYLKYEVVSQTFAVVMTNRILSLSDTLVDYNGPSV